MRPTLLSKYRPKDHHSHPLVVHHFGPSTRESGGIGTVIGLMTTYSLGASASTAHATYTARSKVKTLGMFLESLLRLALLPPCAVVHVHISMRGSFLREGLVVLLAKLRRLPTVVTIHGSGYVPFAQQRPYLVGLVLKNAGVVLCLTPEHRTVSQRIAPRARIWLTSNPVEIDSRTTPAGSIPARVLFAGALSLRKGMDILCEAWSAVHEAIPDATCLLVGPASDDFTPPPLEGLEVRAAVDRVAVKRLIQGSRCVVLPSRAEALPMLLLEAMSSARPFVSTAVGGVDSIAVGGLLVPPNDSIALARAIERLLRQPDLASQLGRAGYVNCSNHRCLEIVGDQLRSAYLAVTDRGLRP